MRLLHGLNQENFLNFFWTTLYSEHMVNVKGIFKKLGYISLDFLFEK